ncbi:MAG: hypothetical protein ABH820_04340 [Patescibacteria group bacterium]|nr:hypothetical protein [Patescibacteria group bacterium]
MSWIKPPPLVVKPAAPEILKLPKTAKRSRVFFIVSFISLTMALLYAVAGYIAMALLIRYWPIAVNVRTPIIVILALLGLFFGMFIARLLIREAAIQSRDSERVTRNSDIEPRTSDK